MREKTKDHLVGGGFTLFIIGLFVLAAFLSARQDKALYIVTLPGPNRLAPRHPEPNNAMTVSTYHETRIWFRAETEASNKPRDYPEGGKRAVEKAFRLLAKKGLTVHVKGKLYRLSVTSASFPNPSTHIELC